MEQEMNELFQLIYETYKIPLRVIARRCGIPYDETDDIIQETLVAYYQTYLRKKNAGEEIGSEKAMLVRILKNKCVDFYRKTSHYETISLEDKEGKIPTEVLTRCIAKDCAETAIEHLRHEEVRKVIEYMKPEWRDVVYCCCVLGYSSEEAGKLLEISGTACRSRLMRAKLYLKKKLGTNYKI